MKTKFHFHRISKNGVGSSEHPLGPPLCFKYVVIMTDDGTKAHIQHIDTQMTSHRLHLRTIYATVAPTKSDSDVFSVYNC